MLDGYSLSQLGSSLGFSLTRRFIPLQRARRKEKIAAALAFGYMDGIRDVWETWGLGTRLGDATKQMDEQSRMP